MWDLGTIIRMNNEAFRAFKEKNSLASREQEEAEGDEGVCYFTQGFPGKVASMRSVHESKVNRCSSQGQAGEELK